jgi:hypothetical protein
VLCHHVTRGAARYAARGRDETLTGGHMLGASDFLGYVPTPTKYGMAQTLPRITLQVNFLPFVITRLLQPQQADVLAHSLHQLKPSLLAVSVARNSRPFRYGIVARSARLP